MTITIQQGRYRAYVNNCSWHWVADTAEALALWRASYGHNAAASLRSDDHHKFDASRDVIDGYGVYAGASLMEVYTTLAGAERAAAALNAGGSI